MISNESKKLYLDWFEENEIPFEHNVMINGIRVFILPTKATKRIAYIIKGDTAPYTTKQARNILKKAKYFPVALKNEETKNEIFKHLLISMEHLKGNCNRKKRIGNGKKVAEFAMDMINKPTPAEKVFRDYLMSRNVFFETQVPIKGKTQWWIADFIVEKKTVVEIDGGYHKAPTQASRDKLKDKELEALGYTIVRITNENVFKGLEKISFNAEKI